MIKRKSTTPKKASCPTLPRYRLTKSLCGEPKKKNFTEAHTEATKNPTSKQVKTSQKKSGYIFIWRKAAAS